VESRHALLVASALLALAVVAALVLSATPDTASADAPARAVSTLTLDEPRAEVTATMGPSCAAGTLPTRASSHLRGATYELWSSPEGFELVVFTRALAAPGGFQNVMEGGNLLVGAFTSAPGAAPRGVSCASGVPRDPFGDRAWIEVTAPATQSSL